MRTRALVRIIVPTITGVLLSTSGVVHAHFNLLSPPAETTDALGGKGAPPCGPLTPLSNIVTKVQGGHPLMVSVMETVPHPGFYRIALAMNSPSELPVDNVVHDSTGKVLSPTGTPSGTSATADFQTTPVFPVLADNLWPHQGTGAMMFTTMITLPNITCAKCTLQVIEFMAMHGPNPGGAYFYHHCAALQITADPALPDAGATDARADAGGTGTDGGTAGNSGSGGAGNAGGVSGTGGEVVATGGSGIVASTGGASATGGTGTGGSLATGGVTGTGGAVTGTGGQVGSGGASAPPVSGGGKSGGCAIASEGIGTGGGSLAVVFIGLMLITRRRRGA